MMSVCRPPMADTPTIIVEGGGPLELVTQFGVGLLGVLGGLLVFGLNQRSTQKQRREDDSIRAAGELLLAMAEYTRLRAEQVPPPVGTDPQWARFFVRTRESEGYERLRAASAIYSPRLTDTFANVTVKALVSRLGRRDARSDGPPDDLGREDHEAWWAREREEVDAAWAAAENALIRYLESAS